MKILGFWATVGDSVTPLEVGLPSTAKLEATFTGKFAAHPSAIALLKGHKWQITPEFKKTERMECRLSGDSKLKLKGDYEFRIDPVDVEGAIALYYPDESDKSSYVSLAIVKSISGTSQISIDPKTCQVDCSANIKGKKILVICPVIYLGATETLSEKYDSVDLHLLVKDPESKVKAIKYIGLRSGKITAKKGTRFEFENWEDRVESFII